MVEVKEYTNKVSESLIVSVCIQTYNHERFIGKCIDSVLMQKTTFPFEILLGEDESIDDTRKICTEYAIKYPNKIRLFLHSRKNTIFINGDATGRFNINYNLKNSNGKYIALCEGDDYWTDPLKLQKQVDFLESNPEYVACYGGCKHVDENDNLIKKTRFSHYASPTSDLLLRAQGAMITNSVMFRNVINGFPEVFTGVPSGDTILYHLLGFYGHGKFLPEIDYSAYRIHNGGIWSGISDVKRMQNTTFTLSAIKTNLICHFGEKSEHVIKMDEVYFNGVKGYLFNAIKKLKFNAYVKLLKIILKQNSFNKKDILKNHLIDLFKRVYKK
ncbi:MAG: glycosyltransferase [Flavobacteriales bacterium]|nr:glycosyltransferase [Flavobacteriales bacterium]MCB9365485.1 glycosyltransferase [Flavobacteriales bacterium]